MKQRLGIAAALLGDPELLILDEPANGLDPQGVREMRSLVGGLAGRGRTVLVSSHDLSELEQVCDWLVLIDTGRSLYQGPTRDLLARRRPADWPSCRSGPTTSRPCGTCSSPGAMPSPPATTGSSWPSTAPTSATWRPRSTGPPSTPGWCWSS